jgi:hypothetical protein
VIIASEQGKIYYCEVFFLDFITLKGVKMNAPVITLRYHPKELGLLAMCANGELVLVPFVSE